MTVDGEGILQQTENGNDALRNMWYKNNLYGGATVFYKLYNVEYNHLIVSIAGQ